MPMFEERERAFEAKYAHDEEFRFLLTARRDKLLAGRVADRLALEDRDRAALTLAVLAVPGGPRHDALLAEYLKGTFLDRGNIVGDAEMAGLLVDCAAQAMQQLLEKPEAR